MVSASSPAVGGRRGGQNGTRSVGHASLKLKSGMDVLVVCLKARIGSIWEAGGEREDELVGPE